MKRLLLAVVVAALALAARPAPCPAQADRTVANPSKKGSLLVWPLVKATPADTVVSLSNEYYRAVKVRCAYRIPFPNRHLAWVFDLLPNQPVAWRASTGLGPDGKAVPQGGESPPPLPSGAVATLACWAVDDAETQQIVWNWLTGDAVVGEGAGRHWQYGAWRFAVNASTTGADAGTAGTLQLSGDSGNYDACPMSLLFSVPKQAAASAGAFTPGTADVRLTLVPCAADLRTDADVRVFTQLALVDETGVLQPGVSVVAGASSADADWFSESLRSAKLHRAGSADPFVELATPRGAFAVHGRQSAAYAGTVGVPLIGVLSTQLGSRTGPVAGGTPTGVGPGQGYVRDASDVNTATPVRIQW